MPIKQDSVINIMIMNKFIMLLKMALQMPFEIGRIKNSVEQSKLLTAKLLSQLNRNNSSAIVDNIQLSEFQVYSQWGDDGIIQFLVDYLEIEKMEFVEFGVESYREANTRFLLINNNWRGLVMDGSLQNIESIYREPIYWRYDLTAVNAFINRQNINELISRNGFSGSIGLLHIDIDGNDYWIWKEISCINPVIVIMEYNSLFGCHRPWTIPYHHDFCRTRWHSSNLYFGSSLMSLCDLAEQKGYSFIGCNSNGNNAYFVRNDKIKNLKVKSPQEGYVLFKGSESRDRQGRLTFLRGEERLHCIKGMEIFNTRSSQMETIE